MATSLQGTDDGAGFGVKGEATSGDGVVGTTRGANKSGIRGIHTGHFNAIAIIGQLERGTTAVKGQAGGGSGVGGDDVSGTGVWGDSTLGRGVAGTSSVAPGVVGHGTMGVQGFGDTGVQGTSESGGTGVQGTSASGRGVWGVSDSFIATVGDSVSGTGVWGASQRGTGVLGHSNTLVGVRGEGNIGVQGEGSTGVEGKSDGGVAVRAVSGGTALLAETRAGIGILVRQRGNGDIIEGRDHREAGVFRVLASGEVHSRGVVLTSDRNTKANFSDVNTRQILEKLACMPIQVWNYKADPTNVHHIGPTSQDFQEAFGLNGGDDVHISTVDAQGIALAAIQGLNDKLEAENAQLRANFARLEARLAALESKTEPKAAAAHA